MINSNIIFVSQFLKLFSVSSIRILNNTPKMVEAVAIWNLEDGETEEQSVEWDITSKANIDEVRLIVDFLLKNNLVQGDKICVDSHTLFQMIGWKAERFESAMKDLLEIKVHMIDDSERTDFFFVHF